jgi:hypothetical protein
MNLFFKYNLYHWRTWFTGLVLSIILGPVGFALIWLLITSAFLYDYHNAVKDLKIEKRHREILKTINQLGMNKINNSTSE